MTDRDFLPFLAGVLLKTFLWAQIHMSSVPFQVHPCPNTMAALISQGKRRTLAASSVPLLHDPAAAPVFPTECFRENQGVTKNIRMTGSLFEQLGHLRLIRMPPDDESGCRLDRTELLFNFYYYYYFIYC